MKDKATAYMERWGIVEAKQTGNHLVYYANYPTERTTYKVTVNLNAGTQTREPMKRYYKKGELNAGL